MNTYHFINTDATRIELSMYAILQIDANASGSITFWENGRVRGPFNYSNILTELVNFLSSPNWNEIMSVPQPSETMC